MGNDDDYVAPTDWELHRQRWRGSVAVARQMFAVMDDDDWSGAQARWPEPFVSHDLEGPLT